MAGVAGDMHLAVGELRVDVFHHLEHYASRQLRGLLIARPVLHVAIVAHHTEAGGCVPHRARAEFSLGKNLQVLVCNGGASATAALRRALCKKNYGENRGYKK